MLANLIMAVPVQVLTYSNTEKFTASVFNKKI